MLALLETSRVGIDAGAISVDSHVLADLGCFDRSVRGSGTICAAAAVYLASKYAPDPQNGLIEAANLIGADTDTIACMVGGLLGIIAGIEWLQRYRNQLQDEQYITELTQRLERLEFGQFLNSPIGPSAAKPITAVDHFLDRLRHEPSNAILDLPDGRKASIKEVVPVQTHSPNLQGRQWTLRTEDGQSLYIKKFERKPKIDIQETGASESNVKVGGNGKSPRSGVKIKAVKLIVQNLERSRWFYHEVLGLKVARESKTLVNFGGIISIISREHGIEFESIVSEGFRTRSIICLESTNLQACYDRVRSFIEAKSTSVQERSGRKVFRCIDPDENIVEVFESLPEKSGGPKPERKTE